MRFTRILLLVSVLALVVTPVALALRFTDDSFNVPTGETGKPYSHTFHGAAGCGPALPYQYRILAGTLPPGLSLSKSGTISGTPTNTGTYSFWVELSDQNPPSQSWCAPSTAQRQFSITIIQGLTIDQTQSRLQTGFLSENYNLQFSAKGSSPSTTWNVPSGTLPPGLSLNASNGQLTGTPSQAGDYHFQVQATDGSRSDTQTYDLSVEQRLKIAPTLTPPAEMSLPYKWALNALNGRGTHTWTLEGTLPAGLTLDAATGVVSGTPTTIGPATVKITVTDQLGVTDSLNATIPVAAKLALTARPLKSAKVGRHYSSRIAHTGGAGPFVFRIVRGTLPAGLHLNARTGSISGTATTAGTSRIRVRVSDKAGAIVNKPYVLKVTA